MKFIRCDRCAADITERRSAIVLVAVADEHGNVEAAQQERWLVCEACFNKARQVLGRKMTVAEVRTMPLNRSVEP